MGDLNPKKEEIFKIYDWDRDQKLNLYEFKQLLKEQIKSQKVIIASFEEENKGKDKKNEQVDDESKKQDENEVKRSQKEFFKCRMILGGGSTDLSERDEIMKMFRKSNINFIVSTNVISRGVDIPGLSFVLNFDPPYVKDRDGFYVP